MGYGPLSWQERGKLWVRLGIRCALAVVAVVLAVWALPPLLSLLAPFALALVLAWLLNTPVRWLQRKLSIPRKVIALALLLLILCVLGGVLYALGRMAVEQVLSLFENWPAVSETLLGAVDRVSSWLGGLGGVLPAGVISTGEGLAQSISGWLGRLDLSGWLASLAERAPSLMSGVSSFAVGAVVFVMASYLITGDYPRLRFQVTDRVPAGLRAFCGKVRDIFMAAFGGYLKSQLLLSLGVFGILTVGFLLIRQPYGLLLAAGLAVLDFIPIVGAGTVMVPWAVVELIMGRVPAAVRLMVIWGMIALFRRVAEPRILGNQTGLSPILSLVGIYVGMRLGGVLGMILGPLLLLVAINLAKLGVFRPAADDLRLAARDVSSILREGRRET